MIDNFVQADPQAKIARQPAQLQDNPQPGEDLLWAGEQQEYHSHDQIYVHPSGRTLHLGDASSPNPQFIEQAGISLVVTAAINMENIILPPEVRHQVFSLYDTKSQNAAVYFSKFYELVQEQLSYDGSGRGSVLVHCFAGISRSATLVISYLMKKNKQGFKQTVAEVRKFRPNVLPNLGFQRQLKQYQKTLKVQQMSNTRKFISKTSQSRKHSKKLPQISIGLPQIYNLGKTLGKKIEPSSFLPIHGHGAYANGISMPMYSPYPSSQMESRRIRFGLGITEQQRQMSSQQGNNFNLNMNMNMNLNLNINMNMNRQQVQNQLKYHQPLTNRLPIKSFRKRSISINNSNSNTNAVRKIPRNMYGSDNQNSRSSNRNQVQLVRLPPHKLAIQDLKIGNEKGIRNIQQYHSHIYK